MKLIAVLLASSIAASVPAVVLGQAADPAAPPAASVDAGAGAAADVSAPFSWTDLLASFNTQAAGAAPTDWASLIGGISADSNLQFIDVFSLEGAPPEAERDSALQAALDSNGQGMIDMQVAIGANQPLVDKLTAEGYAATDVVAITSAPDGAFLIYVRPAAGAAVGAPAGDPAAAPAPGG